MKKDAGGSADGRPGPARRVLNPDEPDPLLRYEFDRGSNYEQDARVTEALLALLPEDHLTGPDHRFFQIVHLITEYGWCAMHHELGRVCRGLARDDLLLAVEVIDRAAGLGAVPVLVVRLMVRHLPQYNLLMMRDHFPANTTGLDSPGARNVRRAAMAVWRSFESALDRHGLALPDLTRSPAHESEGVRPPPGLRELTMVRDGLHRFDVAVQEWKQIHLRLVWTQLGGHPGASGEASADNLPTSLRGRPISDVERMAARPLFPRLWNDADLTFRELTGAPPDDG